MSASSSDDDDDEDFIPVLEEKQQQRRPLRQTRLDEFDTFTRKREAPPRKLLDDTLLAHFVDGLVLSPGAAIRVDHELPYNYIDFKLNGVAMQVWQAMLDEIDERADSFAFIVDLATSKQSKKQRASKVLHADTDKLRRLGWGDTGKMKERLDLTRITSSSKREKLVTFLAETFRLVRSILDTCVAAAAAGENTNSALPVTVILACARGLERSLVLFNLIAFAATLGAADRRQRHASVAALCADVAKNFEFRHVRYDADRHVAEIHNELIHSTITNLPQVMQLGLAQREEKKRRFEQQRRANCYYLYC